MINSRKQNYQNYCFHRILIYTNFCTDSKDKKSKYFLPKFPAAPTKVLISSPKFRAPYNCKDGAQFSKIKLNQIITRNSLSRKIII